MTRYLLLSQGMLVYCQPNGYRPRIQAWGQAPAPGGWRSAQAFSKFEFLKIHSLVIKRPKDSDYVKVDLKAATEGESWDQKCTLHHSQKQGLESRVRRNISCLGVHTTSLKTKWLPESSICQARMRYRKRGSRWLYSHYVYIYARDSGIFIMAVFWDLSKRMVLTRLYWSLSG